MKFSCKIFEIKKLMVTQYKIVYLKDHSANKIVNKKRNINKKKKPEKNQSLQFSLYKIGSTK